MCDGSEEGGKVVRVEFTTKQNLINLGTTLLGAGLQGLIYYKASEKMGDRLENTLRDEKASMPMVPLAQIPFGFP